jgi:hypothetical protein
MLVYISWQSRRTVLTALLAHGTFVARLLVQPHRTARLADAANLDALGLFGAALFVEQSALRRSASVGVNAGSVRVGGFADFARPARHVGHPF